MTRKGKLGLKGQVTGEDTLSNPWEDIDMITFDDIDPLHKPITIPLVDWDVKAVKHFAKDQTKPNMSLRL